MTNIGGISPTQINLMIQIREYLLFCAFTSRCKGFFHHPNIKNDKVIGISVSPFAENKFSLFINLLSKDGLNLKTKEIYTFNDAKDFVNNVLVEG